MWDKVFKNGPGKICGRQLLKNFAWSILEYLNTLSNITQNFVLKSTQMNKGGHFYGDCIN